MSAEPPFEQFSARRQSPLGWLRAEPGRFDGLWLGLICAALACLPVVLSATVEMVDYPAHLGRYHVMLARDASPWLQRYYGFHWRWMGNLGADLLVRPLAAMMPLESAGRLIAALIAPLTALGVLSAEWALRRRIGVGSLLAMAFIWSQPLLLGFLNFGLSLAAALFVFAGWVLLEGRRVRAPLAVLAGLVVWVCHVSGWGILGLMVFGYEWSRDKSWRACLAPWPLALPLIALLAGGGTKGDISYGLHVAGYKWAIWQQAMRDSVQWVDYASLIAVLALLGFSLWKRRIDPRLGWGSALVLAGSIAIPRHIFGGDLADARMIPTGLLLACLALSWRAPRYVLLLAPLLFVGRLALTTQDWRQDAAETAALLPALDSIPQGAKIAVLVVTERNQWRYNSHEHLCGYALVRRDALTNCNFALPRVHMITILEGGKFFRDPFHRLQHWRGKPIDLKYYDPALQADWFWYVGGEWPDRLPMGAHVVRRGPDWLLARMVK